ncbi:MAG: hypothetical protein LLG40_06790 [Deltaproteobacteria bacterium]|nr:hypothetical protein [Deltaproteobacteria bacterium]
MNIKEVIDAFNNVKSGLNPWIQKSNENYNTRMCIWSPQNSDGRKHNSLSDKAFKAVPWDGASDLRTHVVDELINSEVAIKTNALNNAKLQAIPVEVGDLQRAKLVSMFMDYLTKSRMTELPREKVLSANYFEEKGLCAVGVFWESEVAWVKRIMTIEEIELVIQGFTDKMADPDRFQDCVDDIQVNFNALSSGRAKSVVRDLMKKGVAEYEQPEVQREQPVVRTFSIGNDLLVPVDTYDLQKAPYVFRVDYLNEFELRQKIRAYGLKPAWVDKVIEKGSCYDVDNKSAWEKSYITTPTKGLYKIIYAYWKEVDDKGFVTVKFAVVNEAVQDSAGAEGVCDYRPVRYPFVIMQREEISRRIFESRGIPEIAHCWQEQIKIERDSRIDRANMTTCPTMIAPKNRMPDRIGPGVTIPGMIGEVGFLQIPPGDGSSLEVEANVMRNMRRYFGRMTSPEDQIETQQMQSANVRRWLQGWVEVYRQIWSLYKQFGPDEEFFRVLGQPNPAPQKFAKGDDNEKFDFYLDYDVLNNDAEIVSKRIEQVISVAAQLDKHGRFDTDAAMMLAIDSIMPGATEQLILPARQATRQEEIDEQDTIAKIAAGMDVDIDEKVNPQLRLQVLQNYINGSQAIPATDVQERMQKDKAFNARIQKHAKQLQFVLQQQQNAQIGKFGTKPGNM